MELFPERTEYFTRLGITKEAFERSNRVRSRWLSPGYMANPPDRLDGFHDYCVACRAKNDPGRSDENLRSYQRDRRAFEWWAEGDWMMANDLFNSAGKGACAICGTRVDRVSPDHVGPLACGFKQLPLFIPTCKPCNSSKNRRMRLRDVQLLIDYEKRTGDSAASWHVRGVWEKGKTLVRTDADASELSAHMRAVLDCYLRCLFALLNAGHARFLATLLNPTYAYYDHAFIDLDASTLRFREVRKTENRSAYRDSLARRSLRIAFEELVEYARKEPIHRKIRMGYGSACAALISRVLERAGQLPTTSLDTEWMRLFNSGLSGEQLETEIGKLLVRTDSSARDKDRELRALMQKEFDGLASLALSAFASESTK
jgi:Alw26I/Eco31I/Esp3I family type II restriction endonuclease